MMATKKTSKAKIKPSPKTTKTKTIIKTNTKTNIKTKVKPQIRKHIISKQELKFLGYYVISGLVLAVILLALNVNFTTTLSKFYGFIYMFLIPGIFIFRTIFKKKIFSSPVEEYGYPALISWGLHSIIIAVISGVFKNPITNFNLYGTSFIILLIATAVFYKQK